jgi:hypothetical protein
MDDISKADKKIVQYKNETLSDLKDKNKDKKKDTKTAIVYMLKKVNYIVYKAAEDLKKPMFNYDCNPEARAFMLEMNGLFPNFALDTAKGYVNRDESVNLVVVNHWPNLIYLDEPLNL